MNFATTPPTTPGFYAWKLRERDIPNPCWVTTDGETFWRDGKYPATNGLWCRLVPAEEVEKAYREASSYFNGAKSDCSSQHAWQDSRAKRVMEGEE